MTNEQFCLKWNDFETNVSTAFRELREDKDFFDVTLACDDEQIQAHKVILAACSSFFRTVLRRNKHEHPLLYLKGVRYIDLVAVLNFMYHGEVNVAQEQLNEFLSIAEELKVKGLTQTQTQNATKEVSQKYRSPEIRNVTKKEPPDRTESEQNRSHKRIRQEEHTQAQKSYSVQRNNDDDDIQEVVAVKAEPMTSNIHENVIEGPSNTYGLNNANTVAVDDQMQPVYDDSYQDYENYEDGGEEGYDGALIDPNVILSQANAENKARRTNPTPQERDQTFQNLIMSTVHEGVKHWQCLLCGKTTKLKGDILDHIECKHDNASFDYSCSTVNYGSYNETASIEQSADDLTFAKYPCEHCDYVATQGNNLKKHIEAKHLGVTYSCNLCPYQATQKQNLKRHMKLKHCSPQV